METVRIFLENHIVGKKTLLIKIENSKLRFQISNEISKRFCNHMITKISRSGKYLIFFYSNKFSLLFHLGMTGYFRISNYYERKKHDHLMFYFENQVLIFNDIRKFGFVKIYEEEKIKFSSHLIGMGPEPLSDRFSAEYFFKNLYRKTNIKNLLMNQSFVSGLGNIYCSEILFDSKIHPIRRVSSLSKEEVGGIVKSVKKTLRLAIKAGGTTIKNFIVSDEKVGYFKNKLMVYGRERMKCKRCKMDNVIAKIKQSGRSTFFCSGCQL